MKVSRTTSDIAICQHTISLTEDFFFERARPPESCNKQVNEMSLKLLSIR